MLQSGWPLSRHCSIPWLFAALLPMLSILMPCISVAHYKCQWIFYINVHNMFTMTKGRYTQPYNMGRVIRWCCTAAQHGYNMVDFIHPCDAHSARPGNTGGLYGHHMAVCTGSHVCEIFCWKSSKSSTCYPFSIIWLQYGQQTVVYFDAVWHLSCWL